MTIDDRSGGNSDFRLDLPAMDARRGFCRFEQAEVPEWLASIRVKRVETIVLGGNEEHIPKSLVGNFCPRDIKRLSINLTVNAETKQLAKCSGIYVLQSEGWLREVLSGPRIVVMPCQNILCHQARGSR